MQVREAIEEDIPEIIGVLKSSLGEVSSQKTGEIWNYKHITNPFGKSLVLVAEEEKKIVGVRAFMRWKWKLEGQDFSAFRAVDTATHPAYQGKGIFKKLTLKAIEIAEKSEDNFIFNTPNSLSFPGYLKMGWQKVGKLHAQLIPVNPLYWKFDKNYLSYEINKQSFGEELQNLLEVYNSKIGANPEIFTPKTIDYLIWRYEKNPIQKYEVYSDKDIYIAGYVKKHKYFSEFRIVEHIFNEKEGLQKLKSKMIIWCKKFGVQVISLSGNIYTTGLMKLSGNFGPVLTLREVNLNSDIHNKLLNLNNWNYCLGDLELF